MEQAFFFRGKAKKRTFRQNESREKSDGFKFKEYHIKPERRSKTAKKKGKWQKSWSFASNKRSTRGNQILKKGEKNSSSFPAFSFFVNRMWQLMKGKKKDNPPPFFSLTNTNHSRKKKKTQGP